jgi:hypothetical protein
MRENRVKHSELTPIQKLKANCRSYSKVLLKRGKLIQQDCEICGDEDSEMHHPNYSNPRDVVWFCRKHHLEHHKLIEKDLPYLS